MTQQNPYALQNAQHSASLFRSAVHSAWLGPGIVAPGEYGVAAQSTPNMTVAVAGGRAWMKGTQVSNVTGQTFSTQSAYFGLNDAPVTVTIATADATNPRIDLVYVAVNDSFYSGSNNNAVIGVVTGTPAASPVAPAAPSNSLTLATVAVAANATSITNSNISQTAVGTLLAVARGGIDPVTSTDNTAGTYVDQYRGHPTSGLQRWNGSAWATPVPGGILTDSGTTTLSLASPLTSGSTGSKYRKVNNVVAAHLDSSYSGTYSNGQVLATLPSGFQPGWAVYGNGNTYAGGSFNFYVATNGQVIFGSPSTSLTGLFIDVVFLAA